MTFRDKDEVERAYAFMRSQGVRVVNSLGASLPGYVDSKAAARLALANGLATVSSSDEQAADGYLLAYSTSDADAIGRMARQLDKILRGTPAGEIPFELPTTFKLSINMKTARALHLSIPRDLLLRAEKVYE